MTKLGDKLRAAPVRGVPAAETRLARWQASAQRGKHVDLPLIGRVWIELPGDAEVARIEGEVFSEMAILKLEAVPINAFTYDACRTRLVLATAVRDPEDHAVKFGSVDEWGQLDVDMVNACGVVYSTVREELDPIGMPTLTAQDCRDIRLAIEKKNPTLLRSFGIARLSLYLLSTESPPAISPIPASSTGPSSPEP